MSANAYLTDVDYPRHFHRETMPVWLVLVMVALGRRAPDLARPYVWLELGCGSGLNAVIAAAANPLGQFIGIDFNEKAIAQARALAEATGVGNVRFHVMRFDGDASVLPLCDFIVCHGVYSWVAPAERRAIQRIVASRLKPAGLLYLAYMSQPGASAFAAAQRFMRLATARQSGDSAQRARAGLALLQRMAQGGAGYFVEHPSALREVERMAAQGNANYLAHELLNAHWDALHVADVCRTWTRPIAITRAARLRSTTSMPCRCPRTPSRCWPNCGKAAPMPRSSKPSRTSHATRTSGVTSTSAGVRKAS